MLGVHGPQQGGALGLVASQASRRCWAAGLHRSRPLLPGGPSSPASTLLLLLPSLPPAGQEGFWLLRFWGQSWPVHTRAAVVGPKIWGFLGCGWSSVSVQLTPVCLGWRSCCSACPHWDSVLLCANLCLEPLPLQGGAVW